MKKTPAEVPTQRDIAHRCDLDVSTVNKILRKAGGPAFNKETVRRVWQAAKDVGYDLRRLKHDHRRKHERRTGRVRVGIVVYAEGGIPADRGDAVLAEISRSGAKLDQVRLPKRLLPLDGFQIGIQLNDGVVGELRGRLSRLMKSGRSASIGIAFEKRLSEDFLDRLHDFKT